MPPCSRCGAESRPEAKFCEYCGTRTEDAQATPGQVPPAQPKDQANQTAEPGRRFGEETVRIGESLGSGIADWWDATLGILSPIVLGSFGMVLLLFGLFVTEVAESRTDDPQIWDERGDLIVANFVLLAGLIYLESFHIYFYRRYRVTYRWIGPIVSAALVTLWAWVLAQVLIVAGRNSEHPRLRDAGELLESLLVAVFILGALVGYAILWFSLVSPANWDEPRRKD